LTDGVMRVTLCVAGVCAVGVVTGGASGLEPGPVAPSLSPAIIEIDSDWVGERLRLRAQVVPRGAKVDRVAFRYRGKRFKARHRGGWKYSRMVKPRGSDEPGDDIRFKVTACSVSSCTSRTGSEEGG
jgi:hypothetical protein